MHTEPKREWILLADRAHAKIYTRHYLDGELTQMMVLEHPAARLHRYETGTDEPGHGHGSASHHRYAYEDHADFPEQESQAFLRAIGDEINRAAEHGEMDKLILVALPKTLAVIKSEFGKQALGKISGEYAKDLTTMPEHVLAQRLKELA